MPRQIIDVESSRPAYIRRNVTLIVLVVVIVAVAAFAFVQYQRGSNQGGNPYGTMTTQEGRPPNQPAKPPGK